MIKADSEGGDTLAGLPIVVPSASYAVVFDSLACASGRRANLGVLRDLLGAQVGVDLGAPAAWSALEHVRVMQQAIEERRDGGGVAEQRPPIVHRSV